MLERNNGEPVRAARRGARSPLPSSPRLIPKGVDMKKLVIGFGPGRCGTKSLAAFLDQQDGYNITHEKIMLTDNALHDQFGLEMMRLQHMEGEVVGDIGWYWFYYADRFIKSNCRIIYIYRDPKEIAESFWNYYRIPFYSGSLKPDKSMLHTYPWYCEQPSKEAIYRSVSQYHLSVQYALQRHKGTIFCMQTEDLNNRKRLIELCNFLSIPDDKMVLTQHRKNTSAEKLKMIGERYGNLDNWEEQRGENYPGQSIK